MADEAQPFPMRNMTAFWLERTMLVMSLNMMISWLMLDDGVSPV
jgi:hypothetical protein